MSRMRLITTGLCVLNGAAAVFKSFYEANSWCVLDLSAYLNSMLGH